MATCEKEMCYVETHSANEDRYSEIYIKAREGRAESGLFAGNWEGDEDGGELRALKGAGKGKGCFQCGDPNHYARDCPKKGLGKSGNKGTWKGGAGKSGWSKGGKSKGKGKAFRTSRFRHVVGIIGQPIVRREEVRAKATSTLSTRTILGSRSGLSRWRSNSFPHSRLRRRRKR